MFDTPRSYEEKPYNLCLNCIHIGKNCDGPNFLAMSTERWCEWVRLRKEYLGWTNAKVAELAEVSKVSVDRIMSGNVKDIRTTTMQAVTKALVNGTWGQYPCALAALETTSDTDTAILSNECDHLRQALDDAHDQEKRKVDFLKQQISFLEKQLETKDDQLKEKDERIKELNEDKKNSRRDIIKLMIFIGIFVGVVLLILTVDIMNGHFGYFRY